MIDQIEAMERDDRAARADHARRDRAARALLARRPPEPPPDPPPPDEPSPARPVCLAPLRQRNRRAWEAAGRREAEG